MIACTASPGRLFAAPFAVLGSIGVIGQVVNIHKSLKGWGVEPLVFRGGKDKAPVGLIGEITEEGVAKFQTFIDNTHHAFKRHVMDARPLLVGQIEHLATGDIWLGYDALQIGLVDRLTTSDEYISERMYGGAQVLKLLQVVRPRTPFSRPSTVGVSESGELPFSKRIKAFLLRLLVDGSDEMVLRSLTTMASDVNSNVLHSKA